MGGVTLDGVGREDERGGGGGDTGWGRKGR